MKQIEIHMMYEKLILVPKLKLDEIKSMRLKRLIGRSYYYIKRILNNSDEVQLNVRLGRIKHPALYI